MDSTEQDAEALVESLKLVKASQIEVRSWDRLTDSQRENRIRVAKDFAAKIRDPLQQRIRELEAKVKELDLESGSREPGSQNQGSQDQGSQDLVLKCYEAFNPGYPFSKTVDSFQDRFAKAINVAVAATERLQKVETRNVERTKEIVGLKNAIRTIVDTRSRILICDETLDTAIKAAGSLITENEKSGKLDARVEALERHLEHMEARYSMQLKYEIDTMKQIIVALKQEMQ